MGIRICLRRPGTLQRNHRVALLTCSSADLQDKNQTEMHGALWAVLCEEITRLLNSKFECFKV